MVRTLPLVVATALILVSGTIHGLWTGRWHQSRTMDDAVARVGRVPLTFGDWEGAAGILNPKMAAQAEIMGSFVGEYRNRRDGRRLSVLLVCGRPGPITSHSPEVCFLGAGYEFLSSPAAWRTQYGSPSRPAQFQTARTRKTGAPEPTPLRHFWSRARGPNVGDAGLSAPRFRPPSGPLQIVRDEPDKRRG